MKAKVAASLLALAAVLAGCDKPQNIPNDSTQIQGEPFHGQVYRSLDGRTTLTLISKDECELNEGGTTFLCKYTKRPDALRIVITVTGTNQVVYYRFIDEGIQSNNGSLLLSPEHYSAAVEQARIARDREQRAQREEEERRLAQENSKRAAFSEKKTKYVDWLRFFLAKNQRHDGRYGGWGNYPYSFTLVVTEDPTCTIKNDNEMEFQVSGTVHWNGQKPDRVANTSAQQNHPVHVAGTLSMPEGGEFTGWMRLYWYHPAENQFIGTGDECRLIGSKFDLNGGGSSFFFEPSN